MTDQMNIKYATISKTGRRNNNEDTFQVVDMLGNKRFMGIVCDGMGGHSMGEVASETISNAIVDYWKKHTDETDNEKKVDDACKVARRELDSKACELSHCEMGTTMVMASIEGNKVTIAHVGDSRCYLQRPGENLIYQTEDHIRIDFGWEIVARCFFSYRPDKAVPDVVQYELQAGDRLLLCSDGLYKSMAPNTLLSRMMDDKSLEEILNVYDFLCDKQGDDNYTAILIEITE